MFSKSDERRIGETSILPAQCEIQRALGTNATFHFYISSACYGIEYIESFLEPQ